MAKRKSKKANKQAPKKKMKLETVFDCPFCSHVNSVECTIEREKHKGFVECKICKSGFESFATDLTEPTDIFHDWIDNCAYLRNPEDSDA